jgi:hypothetical protein
MKTYTTSVVLDLLQMFSDILVFFLVFCVFLFGFAFAFFILQVRSMQTVLSRQDGLLRVLRWLQLEGCKSYLSALTTTFNISLGSWDWESIYEGGLLAVLLFISFVVIGTIMLLNLLIAVRSHFMKSSRICKTS